MMFAEDNIGYLRGRLEGTVIRMGGCGTPLLVKKVSRGDDNTILLYAAPILLTGMSPLRTIPLKDVTLKSPILGNVNRRDGCVFLARQPMRHDWRQGLRPSNVSAIRKGRRLGTDMYSERDISNAIYGVFVSLEVSFEKAKRNRYTVGFSRKFSVDYEGGVWYKERQVVAAIVKNKPELKKDFFWLKEMLDAEVN